MGRRHKKRKTEKRAHEVSVLPPAVVADKPDKPALKLVLKVGSALAELSAQGNDGGAYFGESSDAEVRHSEKKKKKKKKSEKSKEKDRNLTEEDKKRRKEEKRRKRELEQGDEHQESLRCSSAKRCALEDPINPSVPLPCAKAADTHQTPLQHLLDHLLQNLQRKDPNGFFAFPVTDVIAPGYSMIIKNPMDFSTMRHKIDSQEYKSVTEFKSNFKLMCDNAMIYNRPETIYYKAAKRLLHTGFRMMSKEKLLGLRNSLGFLQEIDGNTQAVLLGEEPESLPIGSPTHDFSLKPHELLQKRFSKANKEIPECLLDNEGDGEACSFTDSTAGEHVLALVEHAADEAQDRLARIKPNSKIGFLRQDEDGTTTLGIVNRANPEAIEGEEYHVTLGMLMSKLQTGTSCLQGFKEDKRNRIDPITYLSYGPFSSFAPQYDSTFANLGKNESDLLYSTYGDESSLQYALSIQEYVRGCGDYTTRMVDNLLDILTHGQHSKSHIELEEIREGIHENGASTKTSTLQNVAARQCSTPNVNGDSSNSLPENFSNEVDGGNLLVGGAGEQMFQKRLNETGRLLRDLHNTQSKRLSVRPPSNLACCPGPTEAEMQLGNVTENLKTMTSQVSPGHVVSIMAVRNALGVGLRVADITASQEAPRVSPDSCTSSHVLAGSGAVG
uniref:bromodomain-containing protein 9-like isoform X2 n=1 Tax=Myxine glutinosa TaxID=7769 RepID=UPI00358EE406